MAFSLNNFRREGRTDFSRLGALYILALGAIAFVIFSGQLLIQHFLDEQAYDSRLINIAGRQRMLSQEISKLALKLEKPGANERQEIYGELKKAFALWEAAHESILHGNDSLQLPAPESREVLQMLDKNAVYYEKIAVACQNLLAALEKNIHAETAGLQPFTTVILHNERNFLLSMDAIVSQYGNTAGKKVITLSTISYLLLAISLALILLEIFYIFKPSAHGVNMALYKHMESAQNAQKMAKEIGLLYSSLERSYEELSTVNMPVENPRLFAKTDRGGNLTFISDIYLDLSGYKKNEIGPTLTGLLPGIKDPEGLMDELIDTVSEGSSWHREVNFISKSNSGIWLDMTVTPVFNNKHEITEMLVVCSDLTQRKEAEQKMQQKDRSDIEKKISEQKFRSVLILEGQEEERKRIAMDIHDGIGQLLTSLKFQIESIDMGNYSDAKLKLHDAKELIKDVIKEVRRVTFNLKPTALSDYGVNAGLNVFIKEINKLTKVEVYFENRTNFNRRLPSKIENNIYRIVQEAINNAIKYAKTNKLEVNLQHDDENLYIIVKDEGIGFDEKILEKPNFKAESGNGFFNMFERTEYINGNLEVSSFPGKGTTIKLTVPIKNADANGENKDFIS